MHPHILIKNQTILFRKIIYLFFFCLSNIYAIAQCINSSTLSGASFSNDNTITGSAFSPLANVAADDGAAAVASATLSILGSAKTNYLKATNFGFAIPASATICGISVWIKKKATGINIFNSISDEQVRLVVGGTVAGNDAASGAAWTGTSSFSAYGSTSDTWGMSLTPAQVNSSNFGVAIAASYSGLAGVLLTAEIDYIMMQVTYVYAPVPLILGQYNTTISGNSVCNKWIMYEEEENGKIILQRSDDGRNWETIETINAHYHMAEHTYEHFENLESPGLYYYRLELVLASGRRNHSKINAINYKGESKVIIYPNPAHSFINITNAQKNEPIQIFAIDGRKIRIPIIYEKGIFRLNTENFRKGIYFILLGGKRFQIIKD